MKTNKLYSILGVFLLSLLITSCKEEEGPASSVQRIDPIKLDASNVTAVTLDEGGEYTYGIGMPSNQILPVHVYIERSTLTTASQGRDYNITQWGEEIVAPALGTADVTIEIPEDLSTDDGETIYFNVYPVPDADFFGISGKPIEVLAVTINNVVQDTITQPGLTVDWAGEFEFFGDYYHWQDFIDLDFFAGATGGSIFAGNAGFKMATGSVPEVATISEFSGDGTFPFYAHLYGGLAGNGIPDLLPIELSVYGPSGGFTIDLVAEGIIDWTGDTADDTGYANLVYLGDVTVGGGGTTMTFTDANGKTYSTVK